MSRRKPFVMPPTIIYMDQPCKNGQPYVAADGSCLRCGADQGVACRDTHELEIQRIMTDFAKADAS